MKDHLNPLETGVGSDLGRAMLRAAASEQPSAEARDRTLAAMGAGGTSAAAAATPWMSPVLKWAIGAGVGTILAGAALLRGPNAVAPPAATPSSQASELSAPLPVGSTEPAVVAPPPEPATSGAPRERATVAKRAAPRPSTATLAAEVAAIDAARATLDRGDAKGCLVQLDGYQRAFPDPVLWQEATVMRVDALLRSGDRKGARVLASRFLGQNPGSAYAGRIRSLRDAASIP